MDFLADYGIFLAKAVTVVVAILVVVGGVVALSGRNRKQGGEGYIDVQHLNDRLQRMKHALEHSILDKREFKQLLKQEKQEKKEKAKEAKAGKKPKDQEEPERKKVYVLDFDGDIKASDVANLRESISAVLSLAKPTDEVVVRLESPGGLVHSYGLAASQLQRIRQRTIPLTICVDEVAASGGYMMACIADKIIAAPFAVIGSIGVVAQLPNFHRLLKKHDIDYEVLTAGEYKRTLTVFGENTDKGRAKFLEDLEDTHNLFKAFVAEHRPQVNIEEVANGDVWFGRRAVEHQLVDELMTSDEYLARACDQADVYVVDYVERKSLPERLGLAAQVAADRFFMRLWGRLQDSRLLR